MKPQVPKGNTMIMISVSLTVLLVIGAIIAAIVLMNREPEPTSVYEPTTAPAFVTAPSSSSASTSAPTVPAPAPTPEQAPIPAPAPAVPAPAPSVEVVSTPSIVYKRLPKPPGNRAACIESNSFWWQEGPVGKQCDIWKTSDGKFKTKDQMNCQYTNSFLQNGQCDNNKDFFGYTKSETQRKCNNDGGFAWNNGKDCDMSKDLYGNLI